MTHSIQSTRRGEQGFTLVELAVVMIIIGVLIGGILKGQELITNARVTSTIAQLQSLSAAKNDFQNQYNAIPGDMADATTRLTDCGAGFANTACDDGDGNGTIDVVPGAALVATEESTFFYGQLLAAGYITGMTGDAGVNGFGSLAPTAPVGGGFSVGQSITGNDTTGFPGGIRAGIYITLVSDLADVAAQGPVNGSQAARIDNKLDDGASDTGGLVGSADAACQDANGYSVDPSSVCSVAYRI